MSGAACGGWEVGGSSLVQVDARQVGAPHLHVATIAQEERQEQHGGRQKKPAQVDSGDSTKNNNYGDVSQV